MSPGHGTIILVTRGSSAEEPARFSPEELSSSANGHKVWVLLHPTSEAEHADTFSQLATLTGGKLIVLKEEERYKNNSKVSPHIRLSISQAFRHLFQLHPTFNIRQVKILGSLLTYTRVEAKTQRIRPKIILYTSILYTYIYTLYTF